MFYFVAPWLLFVLSAVSTGPDCFSCANPPPGTIFCDDFESEEPLGNRYFGYDDDDGDFIRMKGVGRNGSAGMRVKWQKGEVEAGTLHKAIGRSPDPNMFFAEMPEKDFNEIYWRMDIRLQPGWQGGGGDKLSRATAIAGTNWQQSMIAHIWSGGKSPANEYLVLDPASGINAKGELVTKKYNDFNNLTWLGSKRGSLAIFNEKNIGRWFCVVAHVKLNTPGKSDGIFEFWIDNELQAGSYDLDWHKDWNRNPGSYMINAVFFENYWNAGAPKDQERYFDNILISTQPISCECEETGKTREKR